MDEPLVDAEGFPRDDIDLYQVRTARHNIICERGPAAGGREGIGGPAGRGEPARGRGGPGASPPAGVTRQKLVPCGGPAGFCRWDEHPANTGTAV